MSETSLQHGGLGVDFNHPAFRLKPGTININQPNTQVEGAVRGKLRISETGQQFDEMLVTLLKMPVQQRSYYTGQAGTLNRTKENLLCYSRDMVRPDPLAREQQASTCASCPHSNWDLWRKTKLKVDVPPCDAYWYALFIDTEYKLPLQMFIRSKNKKPFESGMEEVFRTLYMMRSQGLNPNIFDVKFRLSTKRILTGALPSYVINISDVKAIEDDERAEFGTVYQQFLTRPGDEAPDEETETTQQYNYNAQVDDAVSYISDMELKP